MTGMASHEELADLWHSVVAVMRSRMKPDRKVSTELLAVARKFLKDSGQFVPNMRGRKELDALEEAYLKALLDSLANQQRTPALLGEARQFLSWAGRSPDLGARGAKEAAQELLTMDVPFKKQ